MTKYSIASYGRLFLSMWDKKPQLLGLSEEEVIAKYTGGEPDWVLHREEATLFRPAHFVAMDHEFRCAPLPTRSKSASREKHDRQHGGHQFPVGCTRGTRAEPFFV